MTGSYSYLFETSISPAPTRTVSKGQSYAAISLTPNHPLSLDQSHPPPNPPSQCPCHHQRHQGYVPYEVSVRIAHLIDFDTSDTRYHLEVGSFVVYRVRSCLLTFLTSYLQTLTLYYIIGYLMLYLVRFTVGTLGGVFCCC